MLRRLLTLLLVLSLCVMPAACGQPEEPAGADVSAPPLAGGYGSAIEIYYPCGNKMAKDDGFLAALAYQQELFGKARWSVRFKLLVLPSEYSIEDETVLDAVRTEIAFGTGADCYLVSSNVAQLLLSEGQTMDVAPVLQQTAPALTILYGHAPSVVMAGLPVALQASIRMG